MLGLEQLSVEADELKRWLTRHGKHLRRLRAMTTALGLRACPKLGVLDVAISAKHKAPWLQFAAKGAPLVVFRQR